MVFFDLAVVLAAFGGAGGLQNLLELVLQALVGGAPLAVLGFVPRDDMEAATGEGDDVGRAVGAFL